MTPEDATSAAPEESEAPNDRTKARAVSVGAAVSAACILGLLIAGHLMPALGVLVAALGALEAFVWSDARDLGSFKGVLAMIGFLVVFPLGAVAGLMVFLGGDLGWHFIQVGLTLVLLALLIWGLLVLPFQMVRALRHRRHGSR